MEHNKECCFCSEETLKKIIKEPPFSKVNIILRSGERTSFIIESKNKEETLKSLIKIGSPKILDYDFVIFEGIKGKAVINISQIDAFTIEDIYSDDEMEE